MAKTILVSVIYNSQPSKVPGFETVVVDNSPPNMNLGFAAGVNVGIKLALKNGAERILLVNPDVKISPSQLKTLAEYPADIVSPVLKFKRNGRWVYDFGGKVNWTLGRTYHIESASPKTFSNSQIEYVSGACMLIKKEVFKKIGYFDERFFMYFEDADFCLRSKRAGLDVAVDPDVVVEHQIQEHRRTGDSQKMAFLLTSNFKFIQKWLSWPTKLLGFGYWLALAVKSR